MFVFGAKDGNHSFTGKDIKKFFDQIKSFYDVHVKTASQESTPYSLLEKIPNLEFFYLGGHGTQTTLSLGEEDLAESERTKDETYTIDISDEEIGDYLSHLAPNAVIFAGGCSNGKGGDKEKNLVNFLAEKAPGRTVIGAQKPFETNYIKIDSVYPFDARIFMGKMDLTYKTIKR